MNDILGFLNVSFIDVIDIFMVAVIIYSVFHWIKGSAAVNIFLAILFLFVIRVLVSAVKMEMMSALIGTVMDVGVLALLIIFQPEIRHFLIRFGSSYGIRGRKLINRILGFSDKHIGQESVKEITEACKSMSDDKTGALIVLPHETSLDNIIETGDRIDAAINRRLIMNLFFKNSPLHDGAVIMQNDRIVAARCTLPITQRNDIPARFGMRHKAAIGISEETDADVIVVSEQTGKVSFVRGGNVTPIKNINELKLLLSSSFHNEREEEANLKEEK